jgi:RNA polymerase sigma-70 factor (ECF subfamily)
MNREDRDVVGRCLRGDVQAFEELYTRHSSRIYTVAYRMTGSAADAEDLLQDIFLQAYRRLRSYRGEAAFGTWLYRLAVNACVDHLRSRQSHEQAATDSLDEGNGLDPAADRTWRPDTAVARMDLERAVEQLPPSYRAAFVLHDIEGLGHHEVGSLLGIAEGTSKSLVHKARLRLRRLLLDGNPARRLGRTAPAPASSGGQ